MAEYIDREALLRHLNNIWLSAKPNDSMPDDDRQLAIVRCMGLNDAMDAVKSIPAADVRPVVRGHKVTHNRPIAGYWASGKLDGGWDGMEGRVWVKPIMDNPVDYCSECGKRLDDTFQNFCPNCGAVMEES